MAKEGAFMDKFINLKRNYEDNKDEILNLSEDHHRAARIRLLKGYPPQLRANNLTRVEHVANCKECGFTWNLQRFSVQQRCKSKRS